MTLQPAVKKLLDQINAAMESGAPGIADMTVQENRDGLLAFYKDLRGEVQEVAKVDNVKVPVEGDQITVRLYTPEGNGPFPVIVFFHGGGWVLGDLEVVDPICRSLANATECIVASVDYRLAPEYKFPVGIEDCYAATKWVSENIAQYNGDPTRIATCGDSAGGNLAAVIPLMAKDRGGPSIAYQIILYGVTDFSFSNKSYLENGKGYYLETPAMHWFANQYFSNEVDKVNPYASPILAKDLTGLPPALVITCEYDVLRDEGEAYAARLREAGVSVDLVRYNGQIHGFFWMPVLMEDAKDALQRISKGIKQQFSNASVL